MPTSTPSETAARPSKTRSRRFPTTSCPRSTSAASRSTEAPTTPTRRSCTATWFSKSTASHSRTPPTPAIRSLSSATPRAATPTVARPATRASRTSATSPPSMAPTDDSYGSRTRDEEGVSYGSGHQGGLDQDSYGGERRRFDLAFVQFHDLVGPSRGL